MGDSAGKALFVDLIFNQAGEPVELAHVGAVPHYAIPDGDFLRHVEARYVDRQIITLIKERILPMKDAIVAGMVEMLGQEGLFTRPALDHAIQNMEQILETGGVDTDELRTVLWMSGFRATVDVHGDVVDLDLPGWEGDAYDEYGE